MKESCNAYLPRDRLVSIASGYVLPGRADGSVLFADISGFTPLTEAYEAQLGSRKGGEELTRVLNDVYGDLIDAVDRWRGSVIGFAGDAITCWFDGDDGLRAVNSALAMQRAMDRFKAIPSPGGGTIALGLKAAATLGTVRRFVVGSEVIQRVDVLAGDPVYRVAVVEQLAERGEVLVDRFIRDSLGTRAVFDEDGRGDGTEVRAWVVRSAASAGEIEPWPDLEVVAIPPESLDPWLISAIRGRLRSGMGDFFTELRPAATLFMKFDGIDYEHDEAADQKLDHFFSQVQQIVTDCGGVVHQLTLGDKGSFLYAAFGAPISHEDDTRRCMAAALRLRELRDQLDFIESVRIGIGRGTTRTGAYGGPTRRTYGVLGDQVNLAARLMGKAGDGQILVSDPAAREGRDAFRLLALPPIRVKGKSMPITVHSLEGELEDQAEDGTGSGYALPMVGRREELAFVSDKLGLALGGFGQVVSIVAEAGLGKSRLVAEVIGQARTSGFRILQGECQTFGTNTLYTLWWSVWRQVFGIRGKESIEEVVAILSQRLGRINEDLVSRLPLLGPVLNIPLPDNELTRMFDSKLRRASLESLLVECLRAEAARQPVLIVLEDVHAIDAVSSGLLAMLVQAVARLPVCILMASRPCEEGKVLGPGEQSLDYVYALPLREFSASESGEWIRRKYTQLFGTGDPVPAAVVSHIIERTGGNPFFIEEVINWMHHRGLDIRSREVLDSADLPVSLHALVLSRMDQLDEGPRVAMKVASVIGRLFRAAVVWGIYPELGGETTVRQALETLRRQEFTVCEEEAELVYLFKHVVIHEVAYESLPHQLRLRMHESIGHFIEAHFPANSPHVLDLLAFHFGRSDHTAKQREYFRKAGDAARTAYANAAAAGYYTSLLPLLDEAEQIPVRRHLGRVLEFAGNWKEAMEHYRHALALAGQQAVPEQEAYCRLEIGDLLRKTGSFDEARQWLEEVGQTFERLGDEQGIGQALHSAGTLAAQTGQLDQARELYTRSMELRRRLGDESKVASLLSNIGISVRFQGDVDEALALQQESLAIRRRLNDPWAVGNSLNNLGMARRYKGDFAGARSNLEEALKILQKVGDRAEIANTLNSLAEVALDQQDTGVCEAFLQESLRIARELGNVRSLAFLFEAFASNAFFQKRPARALRLFGAAHALRHSIGAPLPDTDQARVDETIDLASKALHDEDPEACLGEGASLPLSTALDFAAGIHGERFGSI